MKTVLGILMLLSMTALQAQNIDIHATRDIARDDAFRASVLKSVPEKFIGQEYDLKYHRFNWTVDPAKDSIRGSVTSYFVVLQNNLTQIDFSLEVGMWVDSVRYHGATALSVHVNDEVNITGFPALAAGTLDSITIYYHGSPMGMSGFGSFINSTHGGSNTPILWTLSEPYGAYEWWPCKNDLSDKIDSIDVFVTHPNGYHAASNGLLVSETVNGPNTTAHWKHRYPIAAYLVAIAVTNYSIYTNNFSLSQGTLPVLNYVFPEDLANAQLSTPVLEPVMQFYDSLIAPYPFMSEKYGHAQFGWGGGMEHQTMSFMGGFGYELMAHELLHMWFGDAVTCGTWHDIWLNEGFATYFTSLNYERFFPNQYWMPWKEGAVNYITSEPDGSVYVYDTTDVGRVFSSRLSYYKGAYLLHMLRWVVGDSAFFNGVRNYYNNPTYFYGYAKSPDLIAEMENTSGMDLSEFFADWLYGEGYPTYNISVEYLAQDSMKVVIGQTTSHPSVSFFEMPVPLTFWSGGQDTTLIFDHQSDGQEFIVSGMAWPDSVIFDPELWICAHSSPISVGISESTDASIQIYPNPAQNDLIVHGLTDGDFSYSIFDSRGTKASSGYFKGGNVISVQSLKPGAYTLVIETGEKLLKAPFVKE